MSAKRFRIAFSFAGEKQDLVAKVAATDALHFIRSCPEGNDPLEFIFGDLVEDFDDAETKVLCALTYFSLPASVEHVATLAGLPGLDTDRALRKLTVRSLAVPTDELKTFTLVPMVADFLRKKKPEVVAETGDRLEKRAYALIIENGGDKYVLFAKLDTAWPTIEPALPIFLTKSPDRLNDVCYNLHTYLNFWGRWDERLVLCEKAEVIAVEKGDQRAAGWRAYSVAMTHYARGQAAELQNWLEKVKQHWGANDTPPRERAYLLRLQGLAHYLKMEYFDSIRCHEDSIKLLQATSENLNDITMTLTALANAQTKNRDYPAAKLNYENAGELAARNNDGEGVANSLSHLAGLAVIENDWTKAEGLARKALPLAEEVRRKALIAQTSHHLAKALAQQGKKVEGLPYAKRALEIFTLLGSPYLAEAQATLRECEG